MTRKGKTNITNNNTRRRTQTYLLSDDDHKTFLSALGYWCEFSTPSYLGAKFDYFTASTSTPRKIDTQSLVRIMILYLYTRTLLFKVCG